MPRASRVPLRAGYATWASRADKGLDGFLETDWQGRLEVGDE